MNQENTQKLFESFPNLYQSKDYPLQECLMKFGFDCGDGWYYVIFSLSKSLESCIMKMTEKNREDVYAMQVKEKFGSLRFYLSSGTEEMYKLINKVERKSLKVCESCGKAGKLRGTTWFITLCDSCNEKKEHKK